ncbi:MAG: hypothetical protein K6T94_21800 [Paenibacillus sp.]|nr:hypothetical protein [Paenibacillus sp.]
MRNKYIAIFIVFFFLILLCVQPAHVKADDGDVMDSKTRDRITQQYGLDKQESSSWGWMEGDVGISQPFQFFRIVSKIIINPYVLMVSVMAGLIGMRSLN